jgi:hypothetical protein
MVFGRAAFEFGLMVGPDSRTTILSMVGGG